MIFRFGEDDAFARNELRGRFLSRIQGAFHRFHERGSEMPHHLASGRFLACVNAERLANLLELCDVCFRFREVFRPLLLQVGFTTHSSAVA